MTVEPTIWLAFLGGFVSFISPCVLPLVPAYVGYMSGQATSAASEQRGKFTTFLHGVFFVLGFTIFFVGFGLLTAAASSFLDSIGIDIPTILTRLGGVAVIFFGLYIMKALDPFFRWAQARAEAMKDNPAQGMFVSFIVSLGLIIYYLWVFEAFSEGEPIAFALAGMLFLLTVVAFRTPLQQAENIGDFWYRAIVALQGFLNTDTRNLNIQPNSGANFLGSLGIGIVFAAGWTPCIGPIYASVLALANDAALDAGTLLPAASMLTAYSLGLGIPFLATALALNQLSGVMRGLKRNMRKVEYASGMLLVLIGVAILTGSLAELSRRFGNEGALGDFSVRLEECTAGAADGRISVGLWGECISDGFPKLTNRVVFAADKTVAAVGTEGILNATTNFDDATANQSSNALDTEGNTTATAIENPIFTVDPNFDAGSVEEGVTVGKRAPNFSTQTPNGDTFSLSDFEGKVVLLNFWATWCGPCRVEMPEFQDVYERYQDRGFEVVAVDFLEAPDVVSAFVDELGLTFSIGMDESGEINDLYRIRQYPTSIIIDGHGVIVEEHAGILNGEQLLEILDELAGA